MNPGVTRQAQRVPSTPMKRSREENERFEVKRINHQEAYSLDGACTNWSEEQVNRVAGLALTAKPPVDFGGYWLRYVIAD